MAMLDSYSDMYGGGTNYARLFGLFALFLVVLYLWLGGAIENHIVGYDNPNGVTTAECLLAGLDENCNVKE